jgi:acetyl esterase
MPDPARHPQYVELLALLERRGLPAADPLVQPVAEARETAELFHAVWNQDLVALPIVTERIMQGPAGPFRARFYIPSQTGILPVILYFHGGGYALNSVDTHDRMLRRLARDSGAVVVAPFYTRTPERRFPTQLNEALAAITWLSDSGWRMGLDKDRLALAGDSAGAHLALTLALALRDGGQQVRALSLFYGMYGLDFETESYRRFGDGRYGLSRARMQWYWSRLLGHSNTERNPFAAPFLASFHDLPPVQLVAAELDCLRDDTLLLADRLAAADNQVRLDMHRGVPHGFAQMGLHLDAGDEAVAEVAANLREALVRDPAPAYVPGVSYPGRPEVRSRQS